MCPVCLAAAALMAAKATSGSALAAIAYRKIYGKAIANEIPTELEAEEDQNVQHHDCD